MSPSGESWRFPCREEQGGRGCHRPSRRTRPDDAVKKSQPAERPCIICGKPAYQTICPTCEAHIRGEAIEKKTGIEKKGRPEQGRQ